MKKRKISDTTMILIAMLLGSLAGIIIGKPATYIGFTGGIWLDLVKMSLASIVVCMSVKDISSMDSPEALGRAGIKIIISYISATICAGVLGIGVTSILNPGSGFSYEAATEEIVVSEMPITAEFFKSMFSSSIFAAFSSGDMIQVAIISCIIGVTIVLLPEGERESVRGWFVVMSDFAMSIINIALKPASIGVFRLMASSPGKYGAGLLIAIGKILGTFYLCCTLHLIVAYCPLLQMFTGISPITFIRKAFSTFATAAGTCDSNAVIPVSMEVITQSFGYDEPATSLGIPLGATINKDGAAILCGVVLILSGQAIGISLTITQIINILLVTTLVTSAGPGVPGGGLMNPMIVGTAVGMPLDTVLMVGGFYRFFDMGTTPMNCPGDMSVTVIVDCLEKRRAAKLEKKLQR